MAGEDRHQRDLAAEDHLARLSRQELRELAEALGLDQRTVGYIEREQYNIKLEQAYRIANFFGLALETVFGTEPLAPLSEQLYNGNRS